MADDIVKVKIDTDTTDSTKSIVKYAVAIGGATLAIKSAISIGKKLMDLYKVQENAEKKLASVVKATGGAAGLTTSEMINYAKGLQDVTTFGDEVIISAEGILSTFKNVKNDAFLRTTEAALDMSTILGTDLNSAMVQLGKAVNDPILGVTALNRAGIQFTEDQKETIKVLQESGDIMAAQDIVLKEVEGQMGGAARAAALGAGVFDQMSNSVFDLGEELGESVTYGLKPFAQWTVATTNAMIDFIQKAKISSLTQDIDQLQIRLDKMKSGDVSSQNLASTLGIHAKDIKPSTEHLKELSDQMEELKGRRDRLTGGKIDEIVPPKATDLLKELNEEQEKGLTIWEQRAALAQMSSDSNIAFYKNEMSISDKELELAEENTARHLELIQMRADALTTFFGGWSELTGLMGDDSKVMFGISKGLAGAEAGINSYLAFTKALAQGGIWGTIKASGILASGLAAQAKIFSSEPKKFASGGDFVTSGAQMIMVGDNATGREHVTVEPLGNESSSGGMIHNMIYLDGKVFADFVTKASNDGRVIINTRGIR